MTDPIKARIMVVEDEADLADGIRENLVEEGYQVEVEGDGAAALDRLLAESFDLLLLDIMLPGADGLTICRRLREAGSDLPVLFLTAKGGLEDRVEGLAAGGDDYLPKPFHLPELLLRVEAILRRRSWPAARTPSALLRFGDNEIDLHALRCRAWDGREQELTEKEAQVLAALADGAGQTVTRETILERVWGRDLLPSTRTILGLIEKLRERFERDPERPRHLHTVRGVGYRLTIEPEDNP